MKNFIWCFPLFSVVVACGSDTSGMVSPDLSLTPTPAPAEAKADKAKDDKSVVIQSAKSFSRAIAVDSQASVSSLYLADLSALKECTVDNANQLAYIKAESSFYVCDKDSKDVYQWFIADIKGKDGVNGINGKNGIDGQSIIGAAGAAGKDAKQVGVFADGNNPDAQSSCPNGNGIAMRTFWDDNNNGIKDSVESFINDSFDTSMIVCGGQNGSNGAAGVNGISSGVHISNATVAQCPYGGKAIQSFTDSNRNGLFDSGEVLIGTAQTVCNGASGTNGINGTNGVNGTNGTNGTNGSDMSIIKRVKCWGTGNAAASSQQLIFRLGSIYNTNLLSSPTPMPISFEYYMTQFSNGTKNTQVQVMFNLGTGASNGMQVNNVAGTLLPSSRVYWHTSADGSNYTNSTAWLWYDWNSGVGGDYGGGFKFELINSDATLRITLTEGINAYLTTNDCTTAVENNAQVRNLQ